MERLTEIKTHVTGFSYTDKKEGIFAQNVYAKLAAYEDTGLTPEEIKAQQQEIDRLKHNIDNLIKWNEEHVTARSKQRDRIKQLEEALTECLSLRNIPHGIERVVHEALTAENIEADKYELSSRR